MSNIGGIWRTIGGRKVFIKDGQSLSEAMINSGKFKKIKKKQTLTKKEYGRLAHLIDSNPDKWEKGINSQIVDNNVYIFRWNSYNNYDIIKRYSYRGE